ncbi:hypothetical protein [Nocardiopsis nanhaiensis]
MAERPATWTGYPDLLDRPRRNGASLRALMGPKPAPALIQRPADAAVVRGWYTAHTRTALHTFTDLVPDRLWRRLTSPRATADCPTLETMARACHPTRAVAHNTLRTIADDGFADLRDGAEHRIVRALAGARQNQVAARSQTRGMRPVDPHPPLRDLALTLRLLGVQACHLQGNADWCPCLRGLRNESPTLPSATRIFELSTYFIPRHGLGSTA